MSAETIDNTEKVNYFWVLGQELFALWQVYFALLFIKRRCVLLPPITAAQTHNNTRHNNSPYPTAHHTTYKSLIPSLPIYTILTSSSPTNYHSPSHITTPPTRNNSPYPTPHHTTYEPPIPSLPTIHCSKIPSIDIITSSSSPTNHHSPPHINTPQPATTHDRPLPFHLYSKRMYIVFQHA